MTERKILSGIAASQGTTQGRARILNSGDDTKNFSNGDILVAVLTDPTMVGAMIKTAAIITDIGGITSHPAILSREMGIPCVVNTKDATAIIKNGDLIKVDGTKGEVYVLD
ncbi:hypothetical protein EPN28_00080 [Patescibacteria group bacterium]|nr:MAG: hypothetical protein EPN28_00080 [Patescibacteria group bacterium]